MAQRSAAQLGEFNRTAILRLIGREGPIARTAIARKLGLSPATVSSLTRSLLGRGLIKVVESVPSRGGRPSVLLGLVAGAANALGVKIAPDHAVGVRVSLDAEVLERFEHPFDAAAPDALNELVCILEPHVQVGGEEAPVLLGVGLGVPGVVDLKTGVVESPAIGWEGLPVGRLLEEQLGVPVLVDNDVNTLAIAERLYGRGHDIDHFLTVTIGRGIGLGIVIGGDVYRGARGAGEFGHTSVVENGPLCVCGNRGCLEALVGDPALVDKARAGGILGRQDGIDELRELAEGGDPQARDIYADAGAILGRAVANVVNVFAPELVLMSGEGIRAWPYIAGSFKEAFRTALFGPLRSTQVEVDPWDDAKWARGAAALVLRATLLPSLADEGPDESIRARLSAVAVPAAAGVT